MGVTLGILAVVGGAVVLFLRAGGYLRDPVTDSSFVELASGGRVRIIGTEEFGVVFGVTFDGSSLDHEAVSRTAAELLPIFSIQAEQRGRSLLRLEAARTIRQGWLVSRAEISMRLYERQPDGTWVLTSES